MRNQYSSSKAVHKTAFKFSRFSLFILFVVFTLLFSTSRAQTFRSSASAKATTGVTTLTVNKPAGTTTGDVMIAAISTRPYNVNITTVPAGWTLLQLTRNSTGASNGGGDNLQAIYWKVAALVEPASYTWKFNTSEGSVGGILSFLNVDTNNPIDVDAAQLNGLNLAFFAPNVTTTYPSEMIITCFGFGSCAHWTTPAGMTQTIDVASDNVPYVYGESMCMNFGIQAAAGPTGVIRDTASNDAEVGVSSIVALIPATRISYSAPEFCESSPKASVTQTGMAGGTYTASPGGLSIQKPTGTIDFSKSNPGTYTVTYTYTNQGKNYTATTTVTVDAVSVGGTVSSNATVCSGSNAGVLTLNGQNGNILRWETSVDNGSTWTIINNVTSSQPYSNLTKTALYHAIVQSGVCGSVASTSATITVTPPSVGGIVASSNTVCSGTNGTLTLSGNTGSVSRWESSTNGGGSWSTINNTTTAYNYNNITQTTLFRAVVQSGTCQAVNSASATITVSPLPTGSISGNTSVCQNAAAPNITFTGASATAPYTFTYQVNGTNKTVTTASGNSVTVSQPTTASGIFTYTLVSVTSASSCAQAQSGTATVTVIAPVSNPAFSAGSVSSRCQSAGSVTYTATASNSTSITYSIDGTSAAGGNTINPATGTVAYAAGWFGTTTITATAAGCSGPKTATHTVTTTAAPSATIVYSGNPYCTTGSTASITLNGTTGGTFSSVPGLSINSAGTVDIQASTPGTNTVTYTVAASGGCSAFVTTTPITINVHAIWNGSVSRNWHDANNWSCGGVPTLTSNAVIPSGLARYPIIYSGTATTHNLTIQSGASIIDSSALTIAGNITNNGVINALAGKVELSASSAEAISSNLFYSKTIRDLVISDPAGVSIQGSLRVTGSLGFGNVNNCVFTTGDSLTLGSVAGCDAQIKDITNAGVNSGNIITGLITVERYVPAKRAYRFLTAPVNSVNSIKYNWMENTINPDRYNFLNPHPGYGTAITGAGDVANGFDATQTHNPSMFTFNVTNQSWVSIPNTSPLFYAGFPYRIIVRGDRSVNMNSNTPPPTITTLRTTGRVIIGNVNLVKSGLTGTANMPSLSPVVGNYSFIANPYASTVNWLTVGMGDIGSSIYVFDPTIEGSNGRGGYVSYNCNDGSNSVSVSNIDNYLQSGQAFFVQTTGPNPTVTFKETDKSSYYRSVFRMGSTTPTLSVQLLLPSQIGQEKAADGIKVFFGDDYSNKIGKEDSYKFVNLDENLAIVRDNNLLSIEGRKPVTQADTIPLQVWQLTQSSYVLNAKFENFPSDIEAYLEDKYLGITSPLSTNTETNVPVTITADQASSAPDRYRIVFEGVETLPLHLLAVKAVEKNDGVEVGWTAESENNMDRYEVEKSADGQLFLIAGTVAAKISPGPSSNYTLFDISPYEGNNYYRIKSYDKSGVIKYSSIVKITISSGRSGITVFPNPIQGRSITMLFKNIKAADYSVALYNNLGQKFYEGIINHKNTPSATHSIQLINSLPAGQYQLKISDNEEVEQIAVLIK